MNTSPNNDTGKSSPDEETKEFALIQRQLSPLEIQLRRERIHKALELKSETFRQFGNHVLPKKQQSMFVFLRSLSENGIDVSEYPLNIDQVKAAFHKIDPNITICNAKKTEILEKAEHEEISLIKGSSERLGFGNGILITSDGYMMHVKINSITKKLTLFVYTDMEEEEEDSEEKL